MLLGAMLILWHSKQHQESEWYSFPPVLQSRNNLRTKNLPFTPLNLDVCYFFKCQILQDGNISKAELSNMDLWVDKQVDLLILSFPGGS